MSNLELMKKLSLKSDSKIVFVVIDGLGGIRTAKRKTTELETASVPNLDRIACQSACGKIVPVSTGITPGSGPAHLALFGYDPLLERFDIGRGVLEVLGLGLDLYEGEVAARGNFATADKEGFIIDRRAGRISTEECERICQKLNTIDTGIEGVSVQIYPGKEHRFALILRGNNLCPHIADTDPQTVGAKAFNPVPLTEKAKKTAEIFKVIIQKFNAIISDEAKANQILLRGFSSLPDIPSMSEVFKLNTAAIAGYPLYRGVAKTVGMTILDTGSALNEELEILKKYYEKYDFFFFHIKKTDSFGEDGDFSKKVEILEEADVIIGEIAEMNPDVLIVTGDHSTPADMAVHSWHAVPFMIKSEFCSPDNVEYFNEESCSHGSLGIFEAKNIMELAMANAGKLSKFGA